MISQMLAKSSLVGSTLGVMLIFIALFSVICLWVTRSGSKDVYSKMSKLPLAEGDDHVQS